ncbi:MAG TPA: PDZ domain-containing protein [Candidatus Eisenbacteria bacterium]|jgi:serine protease Do
MRKLAILRGSWLTLTTLLLGLAIAWLGAARAQGRGAPWLGVYSQRLDADLREGMGYQGRGVLITRVVPEGPADRAGLRKGDILVSVNARAVDSPDELARVVRESRVGQTVKLAISRDGARRSLDARLAERPEDSDREDQQGDEGSEAPEPPEIETPPPLPFEGHAPEVFIRSMGRGRLGVRIEDLNPDLGQYFSLPDGHGVLVVEVFKDTPAERAGIKAGDVITQVGDRTVADTDDLSREIRGAPEGRLSLTLMRKGTKRVVEARLAAAPRALWRDRAMGPMGFDDGDRMLLRRRSDGDMRDELRQLREELRDLRQKVEKLEHN